MKREMMNMLAAYCLQKVSGRTQAYGRRQSRSAYDVDRDVANERRRTGSTIRSAIVSIDRRGESKPVPSRSRWSGTGHLPGILGRPIGDSLPRVTTTRIQSRPPTIRRKIPVDAPPGSRARRDGDVIHWRRELAVPHPAGFEKLRLALRSRCRLERSAISAHRR